MVLPHRCAPSDLYYPHPMVQDVLWWCLYKAENLFLGSRLRKAALQEVMRHVHYEVRPPWLQYLYVILGGWSPLQSFT